MVSEHIKGGEQGPSFPALQTLGRGIKDALPELRHNIRHCIEVGGKKGELGLLCHVMTVIAAPACACACDDTVSLFRAARRLLTL